MSKKSVPLGFCEGCRWARELPPEMRLGPFLYDCQALPWQYEPTQEETKVKDPKTGRPMVKMGMIYIAHPHQAHDFCAFFDERPEPAAAVDAPLDDGEGLL
jgi:hypothetical protein